MKPQAIHYRFQLFDILLYILFAASLIGLFSGSNEDIPNWLKGSRIENILYALHTGNAIILNISSGYFGGFLIWLLVSKLPEIKKKRIIKQRLVLAYANFKKRLIECCIDASNTTINSDASKELLNPIVFRIHFEGERWYDVANALERRTDIVQRIQFEMMIFEREIIFLLSNHEISNKKAFNELRNVSEWLLEIEASHLWGEAYIKLLCRNLWEILANFDRIHGYTDCDKIMLAIKSA